MTVVSAIMVRSLREVHKARRLLGGEVRGGAGVVCLFGF